MRPLTRLYQYVNILSLDVVAGAVVSALFFARVFHATIAPYALVTLALTVWIIYTIDHLRDAKSIRDIASTDRHRFHQRYFNAILIFLLLAIAADVAMLWLVPSRVLVLGAALGIVVLLYLTLQVHLKFLKEFFVALLYTAGILLPSLSTICAALLPVHFVIIAKFFITALMNLLLFSLYDYQEDRHQRQHSFVTWFGPRSTRLGILLLALLNILSGLALWSFDPKVALIFISMNLVLLSVLFLRRYLAVNNYYRFVGDAVFFIPFFYLL